MRVLLFTVVQSVMLGLIVPAPMSFAQAPPVQVIRMNSQTVLVDVAVADSKGQAVPGLKQEDFTILQGGKQQKITYFESHTGAPVKVGEGPKLPEGMYSNFPVPLASDAVNILLLDALNTPMKDQAMVRKQMIAYLGQIPAGTRIAIFTLASHLRMVNGFTTDPAVLLATLNRKDVGSTIDLSPLLITPAEAEAQRKRQDDALTVSGVGTANGSPEQRLAGLAEVSSLRQFVTDEASFSDDLRVKMTLAAMDQLGRYLGPMPGRKNLIWFSGSFPIGVDPDFNQQDAYRMMRDYAEDIRATTQRLALARVAVYPIDARRFVQNAMFGPDNGGASRYRNAQYRSDDVDRSFNEIVKEHDTMDQMAEETGGKATYNTNDLKGAMANVINNGSRYYTLAYDPVDVKNDGRYHKIVVKLNHPGYQLAYRHGYVAQRDPVKEAKHPSQAKKKEVDQANSVFRTAMEPGVPPSAELLFRVQAVREEKQPAASDPQKGDNPAVQKPVTRYAFGYAADVGAAQLVTDQNGIRHGLLMTMVIAYDQQGRPLNSVLNTMKLDLAPQTYADALKTGLPFYQELDIPAGDATVRVGMYDIMSHKMGSLEFPLTVQPPSN